MKILLPLLLALAANCIGQDAPAGSVETYRLDFTIHETASNQQPQDRHYSLMLPPNEWGKVRAGSKVPYLSEKEKYNYADVGVSIDCRLQNRDSHLYLTGRFEMSSIISGGALPQIQQSRSEMSGAVVQSKPTRLVSIDDPSGAHHYDIDVIATRM